MSWGETWNSFYKTAGPLFYFILLWLFSSKEDVQEEKVGWRVSEAGAAHTSGLIWSSRLPHRTRRFNGLQSGRGQWVASLTSFIITVVTYIDGHARYRHAVTSPTVQQVVVQWINIESVTHQNVDGEPNATVCPISRSSQTGCCSTMSVPSTQWDSAAHESLPAWKTPTSSASTPAKSRMGEQVHRCTHACTHVHILVAEVMSAKSFSRPLFFFM